MRNSTEQFPTSCNASRHQQFKMAGHKPEILISQSVYNIAAQFQRLFLCFWGPGIQWSYSLLCVMQAGSKNPRWRFTNKKYSCLWTVILDFWLGLPHAVLRLTLLSSTPLKTWVLPLEFSGYDVYRLRYKYFRFISHHLGFLISACIAQYREQLYLNPDTWKHMFNRRNFAANVMQLILSYGKAITLETCNWIDFISVAYASWYHWRCGRTQL